MDAPDSNMERVGLQQSEQPDVVALQSMTLTGQRQCHSTGENKQPGDHCVLY